MILPVTGSVADFRYWGFWNVGLSSWRLLGASPCVVVLIRGEEEVKKPICD